MLAARVEDITEEAILRACNEKTGETDTLDFKAIPHLSRPEGREELCKDICAFANADGGDLVLGVSEKDGKADSPRPITGEDADALQRRYRQTLESNVEPAIFGLRFLPVPASAGGYFMVVRVEKSLDGPHGYLVDRGWRFPIRAGTGTADMPYSQLRRAFTESASVGVRLRQLRASRLRDIAAGRTWRRLYPGPAAVVHVLPTTAINERASIDVRPLYDSLYTRMMFSGWGGAGRALNLDGVIVYPGAPDDELPAYAQVFRNGAVEMVRTLQPIARPGKKLYSGTIAEFVREAITKGVVELKRANISGPAIVGVSLLGTEGYPFVVSSGGWAEDKKGDRSDLVLPEHWIDSIAAVVDPDHIARPILDVLWQAYDEPRCNLYDANGAWNPR